jgi:hydroxyethylthiazole kinase-like uncharacterized protein yjeF
MYHVLSHRYPIALHGLHKTRQLESLAQKDLPPHTLMRRAGLALARLAMATTPHARNIWIAAGPGNNGGDGLEAAAVLQKHGYRVFVTQVNGEKREAAQVHAARLRAEAAAVHFLDNAPFTDDFPTPEPPIDLAIDALLGIGISRPPDEAIAELIRRLNSLKCPVIAADVPSGLNAETGQPLGQTCIRASHTLSLLTLKPGLFTASGRDCAGEIWQSDLDVDTAVVAPDAWLQGDSSKSQQPRDHALHKGSLGDVAIVGGSKGMTGAALLAARAAHAAGAGRVYVSLLLKEDDGITHDHSRPELMFRPQWWTASPKEIAETVVVCGCGGGSAVREPLPRLMSLCERLVLDADALNAVATDSSLKSLLQARSGRGFATILTPHPLEAARLLGCTAADVQLDRVHSAQQLASNFGCVVVLKGSGSIIAAPGATPSINSTGNAALATAGTGDVLAGWIGGLWAQHRLGQAQPLALPHTIAAEAVAHHGAAAEPRRPGPIRAGDLIDVMHRRLRAGR